MIVNPPTGFPIRIGDQIIWLRNYRNKLPNHKTPLGYTDDEITAMQADCDRLIWLMETFQEAAQSFAQAVTSHIHTLQDGPGNDLITPPVFSLPASPAPPANVLPGALKRLTTGIRNLKTRPGYLDAIGGFESVFLGSLKTGDYLEYWANGPAKLFNTTGTLRATITPTGSRPRLATGLNTTTSAGAVPRDSN